MANLKFILDGNGNKIYPITIANGVVYFKKSGNTTTQQLLSDYLDNLNTSLSTTSANAATKVSDATAGHFAGLDANGNLTDSGKQASDFATSAQGSKADSAIQSVKVNGTALTPDANKAVDITISTNYDEKGAADAAKSAVIGASGDTSTANTIYGAKAYADSLAGNYDKSGAADSALSSAKSYADGLASNYDAAGAANTAKNAVIGASGDASTANTIYGAKAYADSLAGNYDASGAASTAESNAKTYAKNYADGLASNYDKAGAADTALSSAKSYADGLASNYDAAGAANSALTSAKSYTDEKIGTLAGALKYKGTVSSTSGLPTSGMATGDTYAVAEAGTYASKAMEVGDYLVYNGSSWDGLNGENQVEDKNASLSIGSAVTVATVDGTDINVTQVEDLTKLECAACNDTTSYDDVASAFSA